MVPLFFWLRNLRLQPAKTKMSNFTWAIGPVSSKGSCLGKSSQGIRVSRTPLGAAGCPATPGPSWQCHALLQSIAPMTAASRSPVPAPEAAYLLPQPQRSAKVGGCSCSAQDQVPAGAKRGAGGGAHLQLSYPKFCCLRVKLQLSGCRGTHLLHTTGLQLPRGAWWCRLGAVPSLGSVTSPVGRDELSEHSTDADSQGHLPALGGLGEHNLLQHIPDLC